MRNCKYKVGNIYIFSTMSEYQGGYSNIVVRVDNCVLVFGGLDLQDDNIPNDVIWVYNLYTEQWRMHRIPDKESAPPAISGACAEIIRGDVYMFGGKNIATDCKIN